MTDTDSPETCGLGVRGVAMAIDSAVWFALLFVAIFPVAAATGQLETSASGASANLEGSAAAVGLALWLGLAIGYHALLEWRYGRTIGKYLVGIEVVEADGSRLSAGDAIVRNALRIVDWLPAVYVVGIAALLLSDRNQRLGDRAADTVVRRR